MARSLLLAVAVSWAMALPVAASAASPREVFAAHDPEGRLPNTEIQDLGEVRVRADTYSIYYLTFVNPVSHHGQHRIAIIGNGDQFAGAYQCWLEDGGAQIVIGEDRLTVFAGGLEYVIRFDENGPSKNEYFCGEGSGWENNI